MVIVGVAATVGEGPVVLLDWAEEVPQAIASNIATASSSATSGERFISHPFFKCNVPGQWECYITFGENLTTTD